MWIFGWLSQVLSTEGIDNFSNPLFILVGVGAILLSSLLPLGQQSKPVKQEVMVEKEDEKGCPFGFSAKSPSSQPAVEGAGADTVLNISDHTALQRWKSRKEKMIFLYEDYVHLPSLRALWSCPITAEPDIEPAFCASCHGMEISFLLLSEFIKDSRHYALKQAKIDLVCHDLLQQIQLLAGLVEDDSSAMEHGDRKSKDLKQSFPFTGQHMPPTVSSSSQLSVSPGLELLTNVLMEAMDELSHNQMCSIKKMITRIITNFHMFFLQWTVGLGIEPQLNKLASLVGLPKTIQERENCLDYKVLVRPQRVLETLTLENFEHVEDFFFRSVHLGTDCWAFIATYLLKKALMKAEKHEWQTAAELIMQASKIFNYLGDHVMMLTAMVLRDYLDLKVEIEGTSGEGSILVKSFKSHVMALLFPLYQGVCTTEGQEIPNDIEALDSDAFLEGLVMIYSSPESYPSLYSYAKALETIESSLLGGFYYKHFMLASNVIGSMAKGTMNKSVQALKSTYDTPCFPVLDKARCELGEYFTKNNSYRKGKIMLEIEKKRSYNKVISVPPSAIKAASSTSISESPVRTTASLELSGKLRRLDRRRLLTSERGSTRSLNSSTFSLSNEFKEDEFKESERDYSRRQLFSDRMVPVNLKVAKEDMIKKQGTPCDLSFHSHAFGQVPPIALVQANRAIFGMYSGLGNDSWEVLFMKEIPKAQGHIRRLTGLDPTGPEAIEFGHNSHELVTKIMSKVLDRFARFGTAEMGETVAPFRILTTDTEFYSLTRQLNRMLSTESKYIQVEVVAAEPTDTFEQRYKESLSSSTQCYDFIYCSQITFTQLTLIRDVKAFVGGLQEILDSWRGDPTKDKIYQNTLIIDAYHSFAAIPTDIRGMNAIYLAGSLKHAGAGANLAFAIIPPSKASELSPFLTGWLADFSVLDANSPGIEIKGEVGYTPGFHLMGSTPAFGYPLVTFNKVMEEHERHGITVQYTHDHVIRLHRHFLDGLAKLQTEGCPCRYISLETLRQPLCEEKFRSHVLVFKQANFGDAADCCNALRSHGIGIDSRKCFVRIGFGLNHSPEDVDRLLSALRSLS